MSIDLSFALARGLDPASLVLVGPPVSFWDASSMMRSPGLTAAVDGDQVLFFDPYLESKALTLRAGAQHFTVMMSGTADVYVIEAAGAQERLRVFEQGELAAGSGERLPEEAALEGHDCPEDAHMAVIERLTGRSFQSLEELVFRSVAL